MKKVLILSAAVAFFAACNSAPAVSESAAKVTSLNTWVDSVKGLVSSTTTYDSATWASYSEQFNTALSGINETELDEASKTALTTLKTTWEGVGATYSTGISNAQAAKDTAAAVAPVDSTLLKK